MSLDFRQMLRGAAFGDNHQHVVCLTAAGHHRFAIDEVEVIDWGVCPDCSTNVVW